jgi:hypothetical protein
MGFSACASSPVLVEPSDPIFRGAQDRLVRTSQSAELAQAPPRERSLFLEAEGFFRYRFQPPSQGGRVFLAEFGAAVTDFPALQSLAGSLNLFDLRIRAPDAAVQLWETFLNAYPDSKLRPLTLYRLGWAYMSVSVSGFPRKNPDDAFNQLIKEQPDSELASYAMDAKQVPWKSKNTAAARSLIPGLGQMYVGDTMSGLARLAVALAAAAAIAYPIYAGIRDQSVSAPLAALGVAGLVVLSFDYTSSYEDAQRGVVQWNEAAEDRFEAAHPKAP